MKKSFVKNILNNKKSIYSQTIEDGVIEEIFKNIGTTNKYFVEFGAWDGMYLSNTANLRINKGWKGLLLEGDIEKSIDFNYITHAFITAENVNDIFKKNNVPKIFDLLSIDIDGNDYWIWKAIDEKSFNARVVIIEYNCNFPDQYKSLAIKYSPNLNSINPSENYYSATIPALKKLGESKGYSLIFRVNLHNLFFVKTELLHNDDKNIPLEMFLNKDGRAMDFRFFNGSIIYGDTKLNPHWNEYADTEIAIYWDQDLDKEWIDI
jgi:hypothetical protein